MNSRCIFAGVLFTFLFSFAGSVLAEDAEMLKEYRKRLARIDKADPADCVELAQWCRDNDLREKAIMMFKHTLMLNSKNEPARRALKELGVIKEQKPEEKDQPEKTDKPPADEQQPPAENKFTPVEQKLAAGDHEAAMELLDTLSKEGELSSKEKAQLLGYRARCYEKAQKWRTARRYWDRLARRRGTSKKDKMIAKAREVILKKYPDGHYKPENPPPEVAALDTDLLSNDKVMAAAVEDVATALLKKGQEALEREKKKAMANPVRYARTTFEQAASHYDNADLLVPNISESYRKELLYARVEILEKPSEYYTTKAMENSPISNIGPGKYRLVGDRKVLIGGAAAKWIKYRKLFRVNNKKAMAFIKLTKELCKEHPEQLQEKLTAAANMEQQLKLEQERMKRFEKEYHIPD